MTELLFLHDAELRVCEATVTAVRNATDESPAAIVVDRTVFYATGGGQPHDTGTVTAAGVQLPVTAVRKSREDGLVWHEIDGAPPAVGEVVACEIDWERRHELMRSHTAMHVLCGVIWNEWGVAVTGGNMDRLSGRMDFEFDPLPDGFKEAVTELVNAEIAADRSIEVSFLARDVALEDADLIRTKVNLIPDSVTEIRVVDIVGLDKQADGGTHVRSTAEVGRFQLTKTESKGKGNKRVRFVLE